MEKRSDFAQKLLDDLHWRNQQMGLSQGSQKSLGQSTNGISGNSRESFCRSRQSTSRNMRGKSLDSNHLRKTTPQIDKREIIPFERVRCQENKMHLSMTIEHSSNRQASEQALLSGQISFLTQLQIGRLSKGVQSQKVILNTHNHGISLDNKSVQMGRKIFEVASKLEKTRRMLISLQETTKDMILRRRRPIRLLNENEECRSSENETNVIMALQESRCPWKEASRCHLNEGETYPKASTETRGEKSTQPSFSRNSANILKPSQRQSKSSNSSPKVDSLLLSIIGHRNCNEKTQRGFISNSGVTRESKGNISTTIQPSTCREQMVSESNSDEEVARIPNIIARMMGLDELPLQVTGHHGNKFCKIQQSTLKPSASKFKELEKGVSSGQSPTENPKKDLGRNRKGEIGAPAYQPSGNISIKKSQTGESRTIALGTAEKIQVKNGKMVKNSDGQSKERLPCEEISGYGDQSRGKLRKERKKEIHISEDDKRLSGRYVPRWLPQIPCGWAMEVKNTEIFGKKRERLHDDPMTAKTNTAIKNSQRNAAEFAKPEMARCQYILESKKHKAIFVKGKCKTQASNYFVNGPQKLTGEISPKKEIDSKKSLRSPTGRQQHKEFPRNKKIQRTNLNPDAMCLDVVKDSVQKELKEQRYFELNEKGGEESHVTGYRNSKKCEAREKESISTKPVNEGKNLRKIEDNPNYSSLPSSCADQVVQTENDKMEEIYELTAGSHTSEQHLLKKAVDAVISNPLKNYTNNAELNSEIAARTMEIPRGHIKGEIADKLPGSSEATAVSPEEKSKSRIYNINQGKGKLEGTIKENASNTDDQDRTSLTPGEEHVKKILIGGNNFLEASRSLIGFEDSIVGKEIGEEDRRLLVDSGCELARSKKREEEFATTNPNKLEEWRGTVDGLVKELSEDINRLGDAGREGRGMVDGDIRDRWMDSNSMWDIGCRDYPHEREVGGMTRDLESIIFKDLVGEIAVEMIHFPIFLRGKTVLGFRW